MTVKSSRIARQAEYLDTTSKISVDNLSYEVDETTKEMTSISGTFTDSDSKEFKGSFYTRIKDGKLVFDTSSVDLDDMQKVYGVLTDIKQIITNEFNPVNE